MDLASIQLLGAICFFFTLAMAISIFVIHRITSRPHTVYHMHLGPDLPDEKDEKDTQGEENVSNIQVDDRLRNRVVLVQ